MVSSGLKLDAGSWKTNPIRSRTGRNARSLTPFISVPSTCSEPPVTLVSPAMARPIVVLPLPLSPTSPSTSPGRISKLTPSTATKSGLPQAPRVDDPQVLRRDDGRRRRPVRRPRGGPLLRAGRALAQPGHGGEQLLRVRVLRGGEQRPDVGLLDDLALVHDRDPVGEVGDDAHVVGDQHDRGAELVAAAAQQVEDLGLHGDVEGGGRLVGDDHARVEHQRLGDDDALLLPAGELVRVVVDPVLGVGDADPAEDVDRLGAGLLLRLYLPCARSPSAICQPTL